MRIDRRSLPPGPRFAPLQTLRYMRDPRAYYEQMRRRYGELFSMPSMNGMLVIALSPEGAREILAGGEEDFVVGFGVDAAAPIIGPGSLLLLSGERHRRERKTLSPTFHGRRMRAYAETMHDSAERQSRGWTPGRRLVMQQEMQAISLDVILRCVLGVQSEQVAAPLRQAIREAIDEVNPAPLFFKGLQREFGGYGPWARFKRRLRRLDELIQAQIDAARRATGEHEDVVSKLVAARHEDGKGLGDAEIRDQLLTLLVAGHETTSSTLAWAFYELARHPQVRSWLLDEIAGLGPDPDPNTLATLPVLQAFCRETLRMHPILAEFFRTVRERYWLQGWEIPAGVTLAGSILMLHENPEIYPEPDAFRPGRFLERGFAPHEFAAFGGGHRHCIGAAFAMSELCIVLGSLLPRFELELEVARPLRTVHRNVTLAPEGGVAMRVRLRAEERSFSPPPR